MSLNNVTNPINDINFLLPLFLNLSGLTKNYRTK